MSMAIEDFYTIEQLQRISISTNKGRYWADNTLGSTIFAIQQKGKIDDETKFLLAEALQDCLSWLVTDSLVLDVSPTTITDNYRTIAYKITLTLPFNKTIIVQEVFKYAL